MITIRKVNLEKLKKDKIYVKEGLYVENVGIWKTKVVKSIFIKTNSERFHNRMNISGSKYIEGTTIFTEGEPSRWRHIPKINDNKFGHLYFSGEGEHPFEIARKIVRERYVYNYGVKMIPKFEDENTILIQTYHTLLWSDESYMDETGNVIGTSIPYTIYLKYDIKEKRFLLEYKENYEVEDSFENDLKELEKDIQELTDKLNEMDLSDFDCEIKDVKDIIHIHALYKHGEFNYVYILVDKENVRKYLEEYNLKEYNSAWRKLYTLNTCEELYIDENIVKKYTFDEVLNKSLIKINPIILPEGD